MLGSLCYSDAKAQDTLPPIPGYLRDTIYPWEIPYRNRIIKTNPLPLYWSDIPGTGEIRFVFERVIGRKQTSQFGVSYLIQSLQPRQRENNEKTFGSDVVMNGFKGQGSLKFYVIHGQLAPEGLYLSLQPAFSILKINGKGNPDDYLQVTYFKLNFLIGYQITVGRMFTIDLHTGGGYALNQARIRGPGTLDTNTLKLGEGLRYVLDLNFGIRF